MAELLDLSANLQLFPYECQGNATELLGEKAASLWTIGQRTPAPFRFPGRTLFQFVFCDGQQRAVFDFTYLDEVLRKWGFSGTRGIHRRAERSMGEAVPAFDPGDAASLPHAVYVEGFKWGFANSNGYQLAVPPLLIF